MNTRWLLAGIDCIYAVFQKIGGSKTFLFRDINTFIQHVCFKKGDRVHICKVPKGFYFK